MTILIECHSPGDFTVTAKEKVIEVDHTLAVFSKSYTVTKIAEIANSDLDQEVKDRVTGTLEGYWT